MPRKRTIETPLEHRILDYFDSAEQSQCVMLMGMIQRAMNKRFNDTIAKELAEMANGKRKLTKAEVEATKRKLKEKFDGAKVAPLDQEGLGLIQPTSSFQEKEN